jgi:hypothetical protein
VTQLQLELEAPRPSPNAWMFNADGSPKRLLWCSDTARLGGPCPYTGERARFRPAGGCCKDLTKGKT